jgi:hypothetical protein
MNNCQNSNSENNSCTPCVGCEDVISSDCVSVQSTISCIDMSAGDNLTSVLTLLGEAVCNFYSFIDSGSGLTVSEVDGSPSYAAINLLRFNQDSGFIVTQPSANTADVRLIPIFLFPDETYITVDMVTTGNITLANLQNLDGQTGVAGSRVLVWKQTIKTENGVYAQVNLGAWTRTTDSDTTGELNNQVVFASYPKAGSQYGGKYFNQIVVSPVIGSDNIVYQLPPSGNKQAWLLDGNDNGGVEKWLGTISNNDLPLRTNNTELARLFKTGEVGVGIGVTPLGKLHVKGVDALRTSTALHINSTSSTISTAFKNDGSIFRNTNLYSVPDDDNRNTSWGRSALGVITVNNFYNTAIGDNALAALLGTGIENTAIGQNALYQLSTGTQMTALGKAAGQGVTTASRSIYLGLNTTGNFSNGIALGANATLTADHQFQIGNAGGGMNNDYITHWITNYSTTDTSGFYFRTSTPESAQAATRGSTAIVDNATSGEHYIKVTGTGNTGWGQVLASTAVTTEVVVTNRTLTVVYQGSTYKLLAVLVP